MMSDVSSKNNEKNTNKNISAKSERSPLGGWPEDLRDFRYLGCFPCLRVQACKKGINLQILLWGWDALMVPTPRFLLHLNTPRKPSLDGTWQAGDHLSRESFVTVIFSFQRIVLVFLTTIPHGRDPFKQTESPRLTTSNVADMTITSLYMPSAQWRATLASVSGNLCCWDKLSS